MKDTQSPEQVAGARIREVRIARHLTQAALAKAMKALGYNWLQTTVVKVEAAERPLRVNEVTDLAGVLGVEVSYLLGPPLTGRLTASPDFRKVLRLREIIEHLTVEHKELEQQILQKSEELRRAHGRTPRRTRGWRRPVLCKTTRAAGRSPKATLMASIAKRPDGQWRARYRDEVGKEHAKHFPHKVDAQRWLDEVTASVITGQYVDPRSGRVTFREYAEQWRGGQVHRPSTQVYIERQLRRHAYPVLGDRPMSSIRPSDIQAWAKALTGRLEPSTVGVVHGIVSGIFRAAVRDRVIVHIRAMAPGSRK